MTYSDLLFNPVLGQDVWPDLEIRDKDKKHFFSSWYTSNCMNIDKTENWHKYYNLGTLVTFDFSLTSFSAWGLFFDIWRTHSHFLFLHEMDTGNPCSFVADSQGVLRGACLLCWGCTGYHWDCHRNYCPLMNLSAGILLSQTRLTYCWQRLQWRCSIVCHLLWQSNKSHKWSNSALVEQTTWCETLFQYFFDFSSLPIWLCARMIWMQKKSTFFPDHLGMIFWKQFKLRSFLIICRIVFIPYDLLCIIV